MLINKQIYSLWTVAEGNKRGEIQTALVPSPSPPLHLIISPMWVTDVPCPAHLGNNEWFCSGSELVEKKRPPVEKDF